MHRKLKMLRLFALTHRIADGVRKNSQFPVSKHHCCRIISYTENHIDLRKQTIGMVVRMASPNYVQTLFSKVF